MSAQLQQSYVKGNQVFHHNNEKILVDAIGTDVVKYIDDFTHIPVDDTTGDPTEWTMTVVEVGAGNSTMASADESGGAALFTCAANENDGINAQLNGESFKLTADQELYMGARFKINDVTQTDIFIGLAVTDTTLLGGVTDRIGFESLDGDAGLDFVVEKDSTETKDEDKATLADDTYIEVGMYFDGSTLETFVDGVSQGTTAVTNLPDDELLRPSIHFLTGEAVANTMTLDWFRVIQIGR